jgi:hypothetical protein
LYSKSTINEFVNPLEDIYIIYVLSGHLYLIIHL